MNGRGSEEMAEDRCIICGNIIPEGRQVCLMCEVSICESEHRNRKDNEKMRNFRVTDESGHQEAIFSWCDYNKGRYPELELLYHVPNGGKRDAATARALKRQGVKAGVPDLVLPVPRGVFPGLYIELKAPGGKLEQSQIDYLQAVERQGYLALVCVGWQAAVQALSEYLEEKKPGAQPLKTKSTPHEGTYYLAFKNMQDGLKAAATYIDEGVFTPAT